jgi:PST family polysaccharide transporter
VSEDRRPDRPVGDDFEAPAEQFEAAQPAQPGSLGVVAARGVGVLVGRTLGLQLLTAGVTVVVARILTPADYGLFAIALAVQLVGQRAAELGLPAAVIRMEEEPSRRTQAAIGGVMITASIAMAGLLTLAAFAVAPALGWPSRTLEVVAVAGWGIPLYSARAMPMALMERKLRFGRVALVETADNLAFNGFALAGALAGFGAFSLAGAVPAGALAGMAAAWSLQSFARRPRFDLDPVRPLAGFGIRVSLLQGIQLVRELGFVILVAAIGGTAVAGFYGMAKRLFSFPVALTYSVARVAFPALSRDAALRPQRAAQAAVYTAIVVGLPLALVAGAIQPLIAVLLGDEWLPTSDLVLYGSLGMMLTASANATIISFALAEGRANSPVLSALAELAVAFALAATLTIPMGEAGVGLAITVSALAATVVLAVGTHPVVRRSLVSVAVASLIAAAAAGAAQLLDVGNDLTGLVLALGVTTAVWLALELLFSRPEITRIARLIRPLLRRAAPA